MKIFIAGLLSVILVSNSSYAKLSTSSDSDESAATFERTVAALGTTPYMDALLGLQTMGGPNSRETIAKLNEAYKELKNEGIQNPTVGEVVTRFKQKNKSYESTDLIAVCAIAGLAIVGAGIAGSIERAIERAWRKGHAQGMAEQRALDKAKCKTDITHIVDGAKTKTATAPAAGTR